MSVTEMSQRDARRDFGVSHTTPTRPDPTRPLYQWSPCMHDVAVGNARDRDDMDAATRRRFA